MPIKIPDSLPATAILESENIFVMTEYRALHQDIRPLKVLILNLMPTKILMINRLLTPTEGTVLIDGSDISQLDPRKLRMNIGYVLQTGALFPNLTVYENIEIIPTC